MSMSNLLENLQAKENMIIKSLPSSLPPGYTIENFHAKFSFLFVFIYVDIEWAKDNGRIIKKVNEWGEKIGKINAKKLLKISISK